MPATPSCQRRLASVLEFQRRTAELVAEEVRQIEGGWVTRAPSLPEVWWLNHVRLTGPVEYEQAVALCRGHLRGLPFDQLYLEDQVTGAGLAEVFRSHGWEVDVELHMVLTGEADRRVSTSAVVEGGEEETLALMERWLREDETLHLGPDGLRQLVESNRLTWRARQARRLGVRGAGGALEAMTLIFSDGQRAQVEDVYALPEARGRGYGRVLVTRAAELARQGGHKLTFIVADDNDWPKHLYAKVGFEPVGRTWLLHRQLSTA